MRYFSKVFSKRMICAQDTDGLFDQKFVFNFGLGDPTCMKECPGIVVPHGKRLFGFWPIHLPTVVEQRRPSGQGFIVAVQINEAMGVFGARMEGDKMLITIHFPAAFNHLGALGKSIEIAFDCTKTEHIATPSNVGVSAVFPLIIFMELGKRFVLGQGFPPGSGLVKVEGVGVPGFQGFGAVLAGRASISIEEGPQFGECLFELPGLGKGAGVLGPDVEGAGMLGAVKVTAARESITELFGGLGKVAAVTKQGGIHALEIHGIPMVGAQNVQAGREQLSPLGQGLFIPL